eukprot:g6801.t1
MVSTRRSTVKSKSPKPKKKASAPSKKMGKSPAAKKKSKSPAPKKKAAAKKKSKSPAPKKKAAAKKKSKSPAPKKKATPAKKKSSKRAKSPARAKKSPVKKAATSASKKKKRAVTPKRKSTPAKKLSGNVTDGNGSSFNAWNYSPEQSLEYYQVDMATGLSSEEAASRMEKFGPNELEQEEGKSLWELFLEQFDDPLVKILLAAAVISTGTAILEKEGEASFGISDFVEPLVILTILILNAIVGVWQEHNAESALEALKDLTPSTARVYRDGKVDPEFLARDIVPGDIVDIQVGDMIPADIRVLRLKTTTLGIEQMSLTGESATVRKESTPISQVDAEIQLKTNMVFAGTVCSNGYMTGVVQATGMHTEIGKVQAAVQGAAKENEDEKTPLGQKLDDFSNQLMYLIAAVCVLVWVLKINEWLIGEDATTGSFVFKFNGKSCLKNFQTAVALAVAAIPEGLPAVITTCLALGTRQMAKRNAIVRKLPSVETLGCTTVICSDKTGTLTTNMMSVVKVITVASNNKVQSYEIEGSTYDPTDGEIVNGYDGEDNALNACAKVSALCNGARLVFKDNQFGREGQPTEAALSVLAEKVGRSQVSMASEGNPQPVCDSYVAECPLLATLEFSRSRKSMGVICNDDGNNAVFVKGAPESVLARCSSVLMENGKVVKMSAAMRKKISSSIQEMSSEALRCLALAYSRALPSPLNEYDGSESHPGHAFLSTPDIEVQIESDLVFAGVAGMRDPPRSQVKQSIADCVSAGIRVIVITGDNQNTAEAICRQIGLFNEDETLDSLSFVGKTFDSFSEKKQIALLEDAKKRQKGMVFSRAEPAFKQHIIRLLKDRLNEVAAMTGDGVNDAPALKLANIGIAMGIAGTEVAKQASDMILADDNFSTIVAAVEEGRGIYNNMKAFIRYMISSNIGEVASIFITSLMGLPAGLLSVQLLWVNLVTDGPPATALGFNPADKDIMTKPPRSKDDVLINRWTMWRYLIVGLYVGFATVGIYGVYFTQDEFMGINYGADGQPKISWAQLTNYIKCDETQPAFENVDCDMLLDEKSFAREKASTLSLTVLVTIEMLNCLNALSEDNSLLVMPPWINPYLLVAMAMSFASHFLILYFESFQEIFGIKWLSWDEWMLVMAFSFPVIILDEVLKMFGRHFNHQAMMAREAERKKHA